MFLLLEPKVDPSKRYCTKPELGNCFFGIIYLFLRGGVGQIIGVTSTTRWWPYHFVMLNKKGHALHFMHTYPHEENQFAPWWFTGHYEGIRRSQINARLQESGREVVFRLSTAGPLMALFFLVWLALFVPWISAWAIYPLYWNLKWAWKALVILFRRT